MVELRSGTMTGGDNPTRTPNRASNNDIPENIDVVKQDNQEDQAHEAGTDQNQGQIPTGAQGVYTGGTFPGTYLRTPTSQPPPGTPEYRPSQFSFLPQGQQSQTEYKATRSNEDSDESETARPVLPTSPVRNSMRALTFEAPMRPLDVDWFAKRGERKGERIFSSLYFEI